MDKQKSDEKHFSKQKYIYVTSTLMRQLIFCLLSLCKQDLFEVFFPGTVSNKLCPFQEVVCFMIYLLSWLWFFSKIVNIYQVYTWLFWYLHNSNTIGSNVVRLNLLFFSKSTCIFLSSRSFYVMFIEFMFFLILLLAYFCKNDTNITAICFPTMFLVYVSLKQDVPEKDTIWKDVLLNQEVLEKIQSAKMFLWNMQPLETDSVCEVAVQWNITKVLGCRI